MQRTKGTSLLLPVFHFARLSSPPSNLSIPFPNPWERSRSAVHHSTSPLSAQLQSNESHPLPAGQLCVESIFLIYPVRLDCIILGLHPLRCSSAPNDKHPTRGWNSTNLTNSATVDLKSYSATINAHFDDGT